jgi:glycosyltransferase involved in cell wall biosynthesis
VRFFTHVPVLVNTRHGQERFHRPFYIWNTYDVIVPVSHAAKDELVKINRIPENKVKVIQNGIDLRQFDVNDTAIRSLQKNGKTIIGIVTRLDQYKDIPNLIISFHNVLAQHNNAELWIVGDGDLRDDLQKQVDVSGLKENVKFWGWRKDIAAINTAIDVFVLPSVTEGLSIALLEAMACHCPAVATSVGGNPEVVVDGETGFLVPPKDPQAMAEKILVLLRDPALAQKMGQAGRRRVEEHFSLERMVEEYEKVYGEVMTEHKST